MMDQSRLTAAQLHWMLDSTSMSRGSASAVDLPSAATASFPDRLEKLKNLSSEDKQVIDEMDAEIDVPAPLLADCDTATLLSQIRIPPDMAKYMQDFIETLVTDVTIMTNLKFQLPTPLFNNQERFCLETIIPHHNIDLSTIAFDDVGQRLALADDGDTFAELQQEGIYKRGDYHITFSWYPGRGKIRIWRYGSWAESLFQWSAQLPLTVVGREQSILLGLWQFVSGIGITMNRLTGVIPTYFPEYTPGEMDAQLSKAYFQWLQDSEGFKLTATENIDIERKRVSRYPVIFEHPKRGSLDFRTSVPHIRNCLNRILSEERRAVEEKLGSQRMSIITAQISSLGEEGAIERYLDMWHEAYLEAIKGRRHAIDNLSGFPDLTEIVLGEERARYLVARNVRSKTIEREQKIATSMDSWKEDHPVMACSDKFVDRHREDVASKMEEQVPLFEGAREALVEAELNDLALLMKTQEEFEQGQASAELRKALKAARKPGIVKIVFLKVPGRWTVEQLRTSGETYYALELSRSVQIRSSMPLWRLEVFGVRYVSWIWNSSFFLVNQASVALRRWNMLRSSFDIRVPSVNPSTGEFDTARIRTLRGRLAVILDWQQRILDKARDSDRIIRLREGLYLDTCWAHFWTATGVALGSASVVFYTIGETVFVVVGAGLALVTSPVWSLVGNVGRSVFNAFVYDCELDTGDNSRSPLFKNLLGIPNLLASTIRGVFHLLKGAAAFVGGEVRHVWNRLWHGLMTILLKRAEIPTKAEGFFWSTSGPGMKNPFVLINSDTSILALLAYLSQQELSAALQEMYQDLQEPRRRLGERIQEDSAYTMNLNEIRLVSSALERTEAEHRDDLRGFRRLEETERQYRQLLKGVQGNCQIRMTAEELESFTTRAVPVVTKFYLERHFPRLRSSDIVQFWESCNLVPGDWQGLTNHVMSSIFTNEIVVPFEAASDDLVVDANRVSGLERIVQEALKEQEIVTGESTRYHIGNPIHTSNIPHAPDYRDLPIQYPPQPVDE